MPNTTNQRPPEIEELRAQLRGEKFRPPKDTKKRHEPLDEYEIHRLFTVETGNRWMELAGREPAAKMLFGELWHQGELCMMFADSNIGKSVLAVQIAESIARRKPIAQFACQPKPQRVLYIDFEHTTAQFGQRYADKGDEYIFCDNFFRAQYNFVHDGPEDVDENELLIAAIEYKIKRVKASVVIIDNITCMRSGTENAAVARSLMRSLKMLKAEHNLSIMVLAHTPKRRNPARPLSADDLHGSKLLINFADSAFALGKSNTDSGLCYLKQIKQRNTRQRYGEENVALCRIQKPGNHLHFKFEGHSHENLHLVDRSPLNRSQTAIDRKQLMAQVADLVAEGFSQREIARKLNMSRNTVARLVGECADNVERADDVGLTDDAGCADNGQFADMQMGECEDEERFADEGEDTGGDSADIEDKPQPFDLSSLNYLPWEAREKVKQQILNGEPPVVLPDEKLPFIWDPKTSTYQIPCV